MASLIERIKSWAYWWGMIIPIQIAGLYSIYLLCTSTPSYWWAYTLCGYILLIWLGVSACYHRLVSHRSFQTGRWRKCFMICCAIASGQGSPIIWGLVHRYHHRLADTDQDPHTPQHGFWHSYVGYMFKLKIDRMEIKYISDLIEDPDMVFAHQYYLLIFWIINIVIFLLSPVVWLWGLMLPAFITFHLNASVNSTSHWTKLGYRNYETKDDSMNIPWLWPIFMSDSWHNNHHGLASSPNFGKYWWELDPVYWLVCLIRTTDKSHHTKV